MTETKADEPFPGIVYTPEAAARADRAQAAVRAAILDRGGVSLFDTEPDHLHKTLRKLAEGSAS